MFEKEIQNRNIVELYDNKLHRITSGVITGFKAKEGYIVIDSRILFPIQHIAKITVYAKDKDQKDKAVQM